MVGPLEYVGDRKDRNEERKEERRSEGVGCVSANPCGMQKGLGETSLLLTKWACKSIFSEQVMSIRVRVQFVPCMLGGKRFRDCGKFSFCPLKVESVNVP